MLSQKRIVEILEAHGVASRVEEGIVMADDCGEWVEAPVTLVALLAWLGY